MLRGGGGRGFGVLNKGLYGEEHPEVWPLTLLKFWSVEKQCDARAKLLTSLLNLWLAKSLAFCQKVPHGGSNDIVHYRLGHPSSNWPVIIYCPFQKISITHDGLKNNYINTNIISRTDLCKKRRLRMLTYRDSGCHTNPVFTVYGWTQVSLMSSLPIWWSSSANEWLRPVAPNFDAQ